MSHAMVVAVPCAVAVRSAAKRPRQRQRLSSNTPKKNRLPTTTPTLGFSTQKNDPIWQCVQGCGACCKLLKGPTFLSPEEIFQDPSDVQLYRSLIAPDGWCKHYQKSTRTCSIYSERPYFCRVEPDIFQDLYGIDKKKFNKEACWSIP